jgi:hypothetical protein
LLAGQSGLKDLTSHALIGCITDDTVAPILEAAHMLSAPRLKAACVAYTARNIDALVCG